MLNKLESTKLINLFTFAPPYATSHVEHPLATTRHKKTNVFF